MQVFGSNTPKNKRQSQDTPRYPEQSLPGRDRDDRMEALIDQEGMKLNILSCYALAWKSFSRWWIPLCLISGIIVVFHIIPRTFVSTDVNEFKATARTFVTAFAGNDLQKLDEVTPELAAQSNRLMRKVIRIGLCIFPFVSLLTVSLLMYANRAVKNRQTTRKTPFLTLTYIAIIHVLLAIGKMLAFLCFVVPGAYLYIKLLFVSLIMLEEKKGAVAAIKASWQMTEGNFWRLFLLIFINGGIQVIVLPTIIGTIPLTGFTNTARAAAFQMLQAETKSNAHSPGTPPPIVLT